MTRRQEREWRDIYRSLQRVLRPIATEDACGRADYWLLNENWGGREQLLHINALRLLEPTVINALRATLASYPQWQIVVAVIVQNSGWPEMGLRIWQDGIVDDLKREYFPPDYRDVHYPDARPGSGK